MQYNINYLSGFKKVTKRNYVKYVFNILIIYKL